MINSSKYHLLLFVVLTLTVLTGCQTTLSAPTPIPTTKILLTSAAEPTSTRPTETESESQTAQPSPSPIPLPTAAEITVPRFQPGKEITLSSIAMLTNEQGWGTSGWHVLRTEDGGSHWYDVTPPEPTLIDSDDEVEAHISILDEFNAWVVFADPSAAPSSLTVWITADGGISWTASTTVHPPGVGEFFTLYLQALDSTTCWLLTDTIAMGTGRNDLYRLYHTRDGGKTWVETAFLYYVVTDIQFQDASTGWMSEEKIGPYDHVTPFLRITHNAGQDWEITELPVPSQDPTLFDRYDYCSTYDVLITDKDSISVVVECYQASLTSTDFESYLYQSRDAGDSWETSLLPLSTRAGSELLWVGEQTILQLSNQMYRSADGGRSWLLFKTGNWEGQFSFVGSQEGWAVARSGENVALVHTRDGGATWEILQATILASTTQED